jgi:hypothetical protein
MRLPRMKRTRTKRRTKDKTDEGEIQLYNNLLKFLGKESYKNLHPEFFCHISGINEKTQS